MTLLQGPSLNIVEAWNGPGRRDGHLTDVVPADNAAHLDSDKQAFEHWYFDAHLDDGRIVVVMLQSRELVRRRPGVEIHLYSPDGQRRESNRHHSDAELSVSTEKVDVAIAHHSAVLVDEVDGLPVYRVKAEQDGIGVDLTFHAEVPPWMPGRGRTSYTDREYFAWCVGAPRARVEGTVSVDGRAEQVSGRGYHDHNWGVGDMKRIISKWYWGRLYTDEISLVYAMVQTTARYGSHWSQPIMVARGREVVLSEGEVDITEGPAVYDAVADRSYPSFLRLEVPGKIDLTLTVREIVHAHDLLSDIPVVGRPPLNKLVKKAVGHPGYFRFRSDFDLTVTIDGRQETHTGQTLHEMVALS